MVKNVTKQKKIGYFQNKSMETMWFVFILNFYILWNHKINEQKVPFIGIQSIYVYTS